MFTQLNYMTVIKSLMFCISSLQSGQAPEYTKSNVSIMQWWCMFLYYYNYYVHTSTETRKSTSHFLKSTPTPLISLVLPSSPIPTTDHYHIHNPSTQSQSHLPLTKTDANLLKKARTRAATQMAYPLHKTHPYLEQPVSRRRLFWLALSL